MDKKIKKSEDLKNQWDAFVNTTSERAFYELYINYYQYLCFVGLKKGFTQVKIKDCFNDLFLYLWENTEKLRSIRNHHNYIITAFLRKLYRKEAISIDESVDLIDGLPELIVSPSFEARHIMENMRQDASRILTEHVQKLPAKQRRMIYQKFYLGLSYNEI